MNTYILYGITLLLLGLSYIKSRDKTRKALKKAKKSFLNILPQFLAVIFFIGIILAILNPTVISKIIGRETGAFGLFIAAIVGSITLIPGFIAFPTADILIKNGAGYMQIGAFISTLMMVGIVTIPIETEYFGRRVTIIRNILAFIFSIFVAIVLGKVVV